MNKNLINLGVVSYTVTCLVGFNYIVRVLDIPMKSIEEQNKNFDKYRFLPRI